MSYKNFVKDIPMIEKLTGLKKTTDNSNISFVDGKIRGEFDPKDFVATRNKSGIVKLVYRTEDVKLANLTPETRVLMFGSEAVSAKQVKFELAIADQEFYAARNPKAVLKAINEAKKELSGLNLDQQKEFVTGKRSVKNKFEKDDFYNVHRFIRDPRNADEKAPKLTFREWAEFVVTDKIKKEDAKKTAEAAKALLNNPFSSQIVEALLKGATDKELAALRAKYDEAQKAVEAAKAAKAKK